jgi:peptide/nickel transport system ATP-binding protein
MNPSPAAGTRLPRTEEPPLLQVRGLRLERGDGAALVDGLDLDLRRGRTLAVVGESGSGKSLTALALAGLLPLGVRWVAGEARFDGQSLRGLAPAAWRRLQGRHIGMIFQEPMSSLNPVMRVGAQIVETLRTHLALTPAAASERAVELLRLVQIPEPERRVDQHPHQLSGGQRQRVMIAMALACDPALLIADEPTTALDVTVQAGILRLLQQLQRERGLALLLITHDLGVVQQVADHALVMYGGRLMEQGQATEVLRAPRHPYTRGLLRARPSGRLPRTQRLQEIPGTVAAPAPGRCGCPFAPRCADAEARCTTELPPLAPTGPDRASACWLQDQEDATLRRRTTEGADG